LDGCRTLGVVPSSFSMTPNSLVKKLEGDAVVELVARPLVRRLANTDPECFKGGEPVADMRLEIRGIFVGVSFGRVLDGFTKDEVSRKSLTVCVLLVVIVPTDGLPAMVGS